MDELLKHIKKLRRIPEKGWVGGVCAGISYLFKIPLWFMRVALMCLLIIWGPIVVIYFLFWFFVPKLENVPDDFDKATK